MLHYLLIKDFLSANEFAAGVIILQLKLNNPKFAGLTVQKDQPGFAAAQKKIVNEAYAVLEYLALYKNENQISVMEEIIQRGENSTTEFKSTLRWDIRQCKKNAAIEHAVLKTIFAFLNSEGGDLLIGVTDDGCIVVETDKLDNDDRFLLHLWGLIKTCLGQEVIEWLKISLQKFGKKQCAG